MGKKFQSYLRETRRPIYSAALLFPFFAIYHTGTYFLRTTYINGADALIIRLLSMLSIHSALASVLVVLFCFIIWQIRTGAGWKVDSTKLTLLFIESCFFAGLLFFVFGWLSVHLSRASGGGRSLGTFQKLVLYCGAGIYEELVFRFFLLGILLLLFSRVVKTGKTASAVWAAVTASLLFSLFHYVGAAGDVFTLGSFLQRALGGLYFSALFVTRGFGVTAASHALYDILVGLIV
jgi:membrane protease YdiL (CAAX protease family)